MALQTTREIILLNIKHSHYKKRVTLLFIIMFYEVTSMKSWKYYHMNSKG